GDTHVARHDFIQRGLGRGTRAGSDRLREAAGIGPERCAHRTRSYAVDAHTARSELLRQRLGEAGQRGLGSRVVDHHWKWQSRIDRADVDDRPTAAAEQVGQRGATGADGTEEREIEHALPLGVYDLQESSTRTGRT